MIASDGRGTPFVQPELPTSTSTEEYHRLRAKALRSLPAHVTQDLILTEPRDSLRNVLNERDRRLRSIIRRYTNQIRYGCHNRNCAAPSCLSYRKRNSKTPLRPHTETSARALACQLVEECARSRKDPVDGLCQNQPVVPWYQDPRTTQLRRKSSTESPKAMRSSANSQLANGHAEKGADMGTTPPPTNHGGRRLSDRTDGNAALPRRTAPSARNSTPPASLTGHAQIPGTGDYLGNGSRRGSSGNEAMHSTHQMPDVANMNAATEATVSEESTRLANAMKHLAMGEPLDQMNNLQATQRTPVAPSKGKRKIDLASYSQMLFSTLPLKDLESKPSQNDVKPPSLVVSARLDSGNDEAARAKFPPMAHASQKSIEMYSNTAVCGLTFRRLTLYNLSWLQLGLLQLGERDQELPFFSFITRSIHLVVGNPDLLLDSAQAWCDEADKLKSYPEAIASETDTSKVPDDEAHNSRQSPEENSKADHSSLGRARFCYTSAVDAFETMLAFPRGVQLVFGALYDTIQQCYQVGHPEYYGERTATEARKAVKGLGGGFVDHTIETIDQTRQIRRSELRPDQMQVSHVFALVLAAFVTHFLNVQITAVGVDDNSLGINLARVANARNHNVTSVHTAQAFKEEHKRELDRAKVAVFDHLDDWYRKRLCSALADCISHHVAAANIAKHKKSSRSKPHNLVDKSIELIFQYFGEKKGISDSDEQLRTIACIGMIDAARTVLLTEWDRQAIVRRTGSVGGALELLSALYHCVSKFDQRSSLWTMPFIATAFDEMEMPIQWLTFEPSGRQTHILAYPFLFDVATLVKYFRAINASAMQQSFENAAAVYGDALHYLHASPIPVYNGEDVLTALRPYMAKYFVLTIRRDHVLDDALDQIWRRQKREVLRPLRVRLGQDEGEHGLDHGGVQQEFFRLAFAEAFNPDYGMFTVDEKTHMTWFQPGSLEPLWRFEALGVLMSLAIYNGITIPITMPLAFYRKILGFKVKSLEHIQDGWPMLEKGLRQLLEYDGDVMIDIASTYEFSYEFLGVRHTIDMSSKSVREPVTAPSIKGKESTRPPTLLAPKPTPFPRATPSGGSDDTPASLSPPSETFETGQVVASTPLSSPVSSSSSLAPSAPAPLSPEAPYVTNSNRSSYVRDYIVHLTDKTIAPQFSAFLGGLHTCVSPRALSLFTPSQLRDLVEGHRSVGVDDLRSIATYEDYDVEAGYVRGFWVVVGQETEKDPDFAKQLLEFVTASERIPVGGLRSGGFTIQRNGDAIVHGGEQNPDDAVEESGETDVERERRRTGDRDEQGGWKARLPSSSTCYGRLLLPRYRVEGLNEGCFDDGQIKGRDGSTLYLEVLRERLCKAVKEGKGFGSL